MISKREKRLYKAFKLYSVNTIYLYLNLQHQMKGKKSVCISFEFLIIESWKQVVPQKAIKHRAYKLCF